MKLDTKNITEQTISRLASTIIYALLTVLGLGLFSFFSKYSPRFSSSSYFLSWIEWLALVGAIALISWRFIKLLKSIVAQQNEDHKEMKDKFVESHQNLSQ